MSTQTHHSSTKAKQPKTIEQARITLGEAQQVERAYRTAAQNAQWTYHHAVKHDPQGRQTETYRKMHEHAITQWTAAIAAVRDARRGIRSAQAVESRTGTKRGQYMTRARAAREGLM